MKIYETIEKNSKISYGNIIIFSLCCLLIYVSVVFFPYYLTDDLWIFRPDSDGYPNKYFVAVVQGRPLFALWMLLSEILQEQFGAAAVVIIRLQAILFLTLFGILVYVWVYRWTENNIFSFIVAVLGVSLPGLQMYVVGGPWFSIALVFSALSIFLAVRAAEEYSFSGKKILSVFLSISFLISAFSHYQSTPFFYISMFSSFALSVNLFEIKNIKISLYALSIFSISLILYYFSWYIINFIFVDGINQRYSPVSSSNNISSFIDGIVDSFQYFFNLRIPMISDLWYVGPGSLLPPISIFTLIILGAVTDIMSQPIQKNRIPRIVSWVLALALILASDLPAIVIAKDINGFSYMTSGPTSLALFFVSVWSVWSIFQSVARFSAGKRDRVIKNCLYFFTLMSVLGIVLFSSFNVSRNYVIPTWLTNNLIKAELRVQISRVEEPGSITDVYVHQTITRVMSDGIGGEFSWHNTADSFYIYWLVVMSLEELGFKNAVKIHVIQPNEKISTRSLGDVGVSEGERILIDLRGIRVGDESTFGFNSSAKD